MPQPIHLTILAADSGYKLLDGTPHENGLEHFTAAHSFKLGDEEVIYWTVDCDLTGGQIQAISRDVLKRWEE